MKKRNYVAVSVRIFRAEEEIVRTSSPLTATNDYESDFYSGINNASWGGN